MFTRDYAILLQSLSKQWDIRKKVDLVDTLVATYGSQDQAVAGCESLCDQISDAGGTARMTVHDNMGLATSERHFG